MGVCGGIAAYKAAELIRLLRLQGHEVKVVMTRAAAAFITPLTLQALAGSPVHTDLFDAEQEAVMGHIRLARWADRIVIAPATADVVAKLSHGLADDLLTALVLAATVPVYLAPAMNQAMWHKKATQANIVRLREYGFHFIGPNPGKQACGEEGFGRMAEPFEICRGLDAALARHEALKGYKILITAGPTREYLDPIRFISNRSSGKMGYALAQAALNAGAEVVLVSGPVALPAPSRAQTIAVETAAQMFDAVMGRAPASDIYIGAAAVADYRPTAFAHEKIKKNQARTTLALEKTDDILAAVALLDRRPFTVGFAAETEDLERYARAKLAEKKLDMIAANRVGGEEGGFDSDNNELAVFWRDGEKLLPMAAKADIAATLIDLIAEQAAGRRNPFPRPV